MSNKNTFAPGGVLYGYVGDDQFLFTSWREVWTAVTTEGHELAKHTSWILSARRRVKPMALTKIRISLDVSPPIVETVFPRWFGWTGIVAFGFIFWCFVVTFIGG